MGKEYKDKIFKSRLGLRLITAIGIVVLVTMIFFEYLAYENIKMPARHFGEFLFLHSVHTVVTLFLLLTIIYYIIAVHVLKPIRKLLYALEEMGKGKFVTSLEIKSGDEFESLANSFNDMGFKLREHVQRLVRMEKYGSAMAISRRVINELRTPSSSFMGNLKLFHSLTEESSQLSRITGLLYSDFKTVESKLKELEQIKIPEELLRSDKEHE